MGAKGHPKSIPGKQWAPHPGPQTRFLASAADEALYGGAAGGGKTDSLVIAPLRWIDQPTFAAVLFRRTTPELKRAGGLVERTWQFYPALGGRYSWSDKIWRFPSGARIELGAMDLESDCFKYQGGEWQYIAFDELTSFTERQYLYLFSRLRSVAGLPCLMRAGSNPGGLGHDWVLRRFAPWLYRPGVRTDEYAGPYADPFEVRWFCVDELGAEHPSEPGTPGAQSRAFFPALFSDNPALLLNDPDYVARLDKLDPVTRKQLKEGDWMTRAAPGELFRREWFRIVDRGPERLALARVRYWDRAATEGEKRARSNSTSGPAWTAGVLMSMDVDGVVYIEHIDRFREGPNGVERRIVERAEEDKRRFGDVRICLEQDPGQAGKVEVHHYITGSLAGYDVHAVLPTGDKVTRAKPLSAQCEHRNVRVLRGDWNEAWFAEAEMFPLGFKDQIDGASGAYGQLARASSGDVETGGATPLGGDMGGF